MVSYEDKNVQNMALRFVYALKGGDSIKWADAESAGVLFIELGELSEVYRRLY